MQLCTGPLSAEECFASMRDALALPLIGPILWNTAFIALLNGSYAVEAPV